MVYIKYNDDGFIYAMSFVEPKNKSLWTEIEDFEFPNLADGVYAEYWFKNGEITYNLKQIEEDNTEPEIIDKRLYEIYSEITYCKKKLCDSDYKAIKFSEGELSEEEYEPVRIERRKLRVRINELEEEIENNGLLH